MKTRKFAPALAMSFAAMLVLSGCSSATETDAKPKPSQSSTATPKPTPSATPTETSTPSPTTTPEPVPAPEVAPENVPAPAQDTHIVLGAEELRIETPNGEVKQRFAYESNPAEAVNALTDIFGFEPTTKYWDKEWCWEEMNDYTWDNLTLSFHAKDKNPSSASDFLLQVRSDKTTPGIVVESPHDGRIGGSFDELAASTPELPEESSEHDGKTYSRALDEQKANTPLGDMNMEAHGTVVAGENGKITGIAAPWSYLGDC